MFAFRNRAFLALLSALLVTLGCELANRGDDPNANRQAGPSSLAQVVATEIVYCIDVSNGTTDEELQVEVAGILAGLANESIVPGDGSVAAAVVVYGDSVATAVDALTPITSESLVSVFTPALTGLVDDRIVSPDSTNLGGGLALSGDVLALGDTDNQYVIVVGDGNVDKGPDVAGECGELAQAGVTICALAVDAAQAGSDLLSGCVDETDGFFAEVADPDGFLPASNACLAFINVFQIVLQPEAASAPRGTEHTVRAAAFRGEAPGSFPLEGVEVTFTVFDGPNAGDGGQAMTDTAGVASFTYLGDACAGLDGIEGAYSSPTTGAAVTDTVGMVWTSNAPVCDAGGPYEVTDVTSPIALDGTGSSDPDTADVLTYAWSINCETAGFDDPTSATPNLTLGTDCGCGPFTLRLEVSDGCDTTACFTELAVRDTIPPVIVPRGPVELWPPNHRLRTITPEMCIAVVSDNCDTDLDLLDIVVVSVTSDEPENTEGDGNTSGDIVIDCPNTVRVRAEREGGGDGRVYTIVYRVADEAGNETTVDCRVEVPHDRSGRGAVDTVGGGYEVQSDCR